MTAAVLPTGGTASPSTSDVVASDKYATPDHRHPDYASFEEDRAALRVVVAGTRKIWSELGTYLPKHEAEESDDHLKRGQFTELYNATGKTIGTMSGLVFRQSPTISDDAKVFKQHYEMLDAKGTHGDVFLRNAFKDALTTGFGAFVVEYAQVPEVQTGGSLKKRDKKVRKLRPYWNYFPAEQIWSWAYGTRDNEEYLTHVVLSEKRLTRVGAFGLEYQDAFRVYRHDLDTDEITSEVWQKRALPGQKAQLVMTEGPFPIVGPSRIPVKLFQLGDPIGSVIARPPLLDLCDANLAHYRVSADRRWLMHLCCVPIPWARELQEDDEDGDGEDKKPAASLKYGPNVLVRLGEGGEFGWAEPAGSAFTPTKDEIEKLENRMAALGLAFIQRDNRQAETAEARRLDGSSQGATLADAARNFEDAVEGGMVFHAEYEHVAKEVDGVLSGGSFSLNREYEQTIMSDSTLSILSSMEEKGQLTIDTLWDLMITGKILTEGQFNPVQEKATLALARDVPDPKPSAGDETAAALARPRKRVAAKATAKTATKPATKKRPKAAAAA